MPLYNTIIVHDGHHTLPDLTTPNLCNCYHHQALKNSAACAGVILGAVMPSWLVSFTLTIVLGYVAYNASFKAASLVKKEAEEGKVEQRPQAAPHVSASMLPLMPVSPRYLCCLGQMTTCHALSS